jgi:hypothetical protein
MSLSHRSSGRAAEPSHNHLADRGIDANSSADGGNSPLSSTRLGRRQLAAVRASLSDRDLAVLHSLEALHFATTKQLERLHFVLLGTRPLAAARAATRCLSRLHDLRLLDHLERRIGGVRAGSAAFVWRLAPAGVRLLGTADRRRSREPSLAHLAHVLAVAELVVCLHERSRRGDIELLAIDTEPDCWRPFIGAHGGRVWLKPDLRLTVGRDEHELHWFIEVDRGTEHRSALTRKLRAYLTAWRDGGEQTRAGVFPRVLWIAPDDHRALVITQTWQSLGGVPDGMFLATAAADAVAALTKLPSGGSS